MISVEQPAQTGGAAGEPPLSDAMVSQLRSCSPGIHFSDCMDGDVAGATPALALFGFNLHPVRHQYRIDGVPVESRKHRPGFTADLQGAGGVEVAGIELANDSGCGK